MKAIAVRPGEKDSMRLIELPKPSVGDVPGGRGVLVRVLRVGVDATDAEINEALYGKAPEGEDLLVLGHESFGVVEAVGENVPAELAPGTCVVAMVRRPGGSIYDQIGRQDMTTDAAPRERGISLLHGFLTEYFVDDAAYIVPLPGVLAGTGVLLEPLSISEKGIAQAFAAQRRLQVWQPQRAAVLGVGPIGMLAALALHLRGLDVTCYSRRKAPYLNSDLLAEIGVAYASADQGGFRGASNAHGPFDIVFEATGYSPLAWEAADVLAPNGVLILSSVTTGDGTHEVHSDRINQGFVLGNKLMLGTVNAAREDFERGVSDLVLAEARYPGWLAKLLTTPIRGLQNHGAMLEALKNDREAIKIYVQVAE